MKHDSSCTLRSDLSGLLLLEHLPSSWHDIKRLDLINYLSGGWFKKKFHPRLVDFPV